MANSAGVPRSLNNSKICYVLHSVPAFCRVQLCYVRCVVIRHSTVHFQRLGYFMTFAQSYNSAD